MKSIALIEDDRLLLKRLGSFLNKQKGLKCIISASSLGQFFECLEEGMKPDLLLLDIELSGAVNTIHHLGKVKSLLPEAKVIVITGHNHPGYLLGALQNGADSFYLKGSGLPKLLDAIEATCAGGAYLDPPAAAHMLSYLRQKPASPEGGPTDSEMPGATFSEASGQAQLQLSQRERQVAKGLVKGESYMDIARNINVSVNTVRHYVKVLYKKFKVANKIQLSNKLKSYF